MFFNPSTSIARDFADSAKEVMLSVDRVRCCTAGCMEVSEFTNLLIWSLQDGNLCSVDDSLRMLTVFSICQCRESDVEVALCRSWLYVGVGCA